MLVSTDAKALEVLVAAWLSQDPILCKETIGGIDMHTTNQRDFGLPDRGIAKTLVFRILYGGTEFSFAQDPEFTPISSSQSFWKKKIDQFYDKYKGVADWHSRIIQEATRTGKVVSPLGREWNFSILPSGDWPLTQIKNYPVQGTGADIMCVARVSFARRFSSLGISGKLISTVHDSIVVDVEDSEVERTCQMFHDVFRDIPMNIKRIFGVDFNIPTRCEVEYGPNLKESLTYIPKLV